MHSNPNASHSVLKLLWSFSTLCGWSAKAKYIFLLRYSQFQAKAPSRRFGTSHCIWSIESYLVNQFLHCKLLFFAWSQRCRALDIIHNVVLFHAVGTSTNPIFHWRHRRCSLLQCSAHIYCAFLSIFRLLNTSSRLRTSSCNE